MPLFEEFRQTSREMFESDSDSNVSWDVCLNSSKSGTFVEKRVTLIYVWRPALPGRTSAWRGRNLVVTDTTFKVARIKIKTNVPGNV